MSSVEEGGGDRTTVYMLVSNDKYELPLMIADSAAELSRRLHLSEGTVSSTISCDKKRGYRCRYVKVEIDDDDE